MRSKVFFHLRIIFLAKKIKIKGNVHKYPPPPKKNRANTKYEKGHKCPTVGVATM